MKRRLIGVAFVIAAAATALGLGASAAFADVTITAIYPVTGSTYLNSPDTTASLGPGTLTASEDINTGIISDGALSLPPATASFTVLGIPTTATTEFIQVGQATGAIQAGTGILTTTAQFNLQITAINEGGLPLYVGPDCQTVVPITVTLTSTERFRPLVGGTLTGTYTIPLFNNCGLLDVLAPVIDLVVSGPGNTISLTLGTPTKG